MGRFEAARGCSYVRWLGLLCAAKSRHAIGVRPLAAAQWFVLKGLVVLSLTSAGRLLRYQPSRRICGHRTPSLREALLVSKFPKANSPLERQRAMTTVACEPLVPTLPLDSMVAPLRSLPKLCRRNPCLLPYSAMAAPLPSLPGARRQLTSGVCPPPPSRPSSRLEWPALTAIWRAASGPTPRLVKVCGGHSALACVASVTVALARVASAEGFFARLAPSRLRASLIFSGRTFGMVRTAAGALAMFAFPPGPPQDC